VCEENENDYKFIIRNNVQDVLERKVFFIFIEAYG